VRNGGLTSTAIYHLRKVTSFSELCSVQMKQHQFMSLHNRRQQRTQSVTPTVIFNSDINRNLMYNIQHYEASQLVNLVWIKHFWYFSYKLVWHSETPPKTCSATRAKSLFKSGLTRIIECMHTHVLTDAAMHCRWCLQGIMSHMFLGEWILNRLSTLSPNQNQVTLSKPLRFKLPT